jgi:hypothetical protein
MRPLTRGLIEDLAQIAAQSKPKEYSLTIVFTQLYISIEVFYAL